MAPEKPPFDLEQADTLLTTTRAVRRRLDLDRPVQRKIIEQCLEIALQAYRLKPSGLAVDSGDRPGNARRVGEVVPPRRG